MAARLSARFDWPGAGRRHRNRSYHYETYIPAFRYPPQAQSRLPRPHEHQGRSPRDLRASRQGPRCPVGLRPQPQQALIASSVVDALAGAAFPRAARLLEPDDFVRALKTRAQRGRYLWVYRRTDGASPGGEAIPAAANIAPPPVRPRLGMMIGKKNARTAVLRNAVKRRIREQFRQRQSGLPPSQYVACGHCSTGVDVDSGQ